MSLKEARKGKEGREERNIQYNQNLANTKEYLASKNG